MNSLQKRALAILILFGVGLSTMAVCYNLIGPGALYGCFPLFGIAAILVLPSKKIGKEGEVLLDERDLTIESIASSRGFAASYSMFVLGGFALWYYFVSTDNLATAGMFIIPLLELAGGSIYFIVFGLTVFHLYKKGPCFE